MESGQNNVHSLVYDKAEIMKQKKNIAGLVSEIALPLAKEFGYDLWDVEYVKEGADMILRITIDTDAEGGITIDDCEKMHRAIDPLLDELDPIEESYMLSVSSPGVERELTKPMHYEKMKGSEVEVRLYAALDVECGVQSDFNLTALHFFVVHGFSEFSLDAGRRNGKHIRLLDGVKLVKKRVDGAVHFFAVVDGDAALRVGVYCYTQDHIRAFLNVLHVPEVIAEFLCEGQCDFADESRNVFFLLHNFRLIINKRVDVILPTLHYFLSFLR